MVKPEWRWVPTYKSGNGLVTISEAGIPECPVSYIGAEARRWVQDYLALGWARRATGAGGGDLSRWNARKVDAFALLEMESESRKEALSGGGGE